jgi:hypothetical protein
MAAFPLGSSLILSIIGFLEIGFLERPKTRSDFGDKNAELFFIPSTMCIIVGEIEGVDFWEF